MTVPALLLSAVLMVLSVLVAYVLFAAATRRPAPWAVLGAGAALFALALPGIAWAGGDAAQDSAGQGIWGWVLGGVVSTLGGLFGVTSWKERARKIEATVLAAAKNAARAVGVSVQKRVIDGAEAFSKWDGMFEAWALKECGKLPSPLRGMATAAAHGVFQELHLYADQAKHEAVKQLEDAVRSFDDRLRDFERAWPSISAQADKLASMTRRLPLAPAPQTTASGEVGK